MKRKLKDPGDYPQFAFRLSLSDKVWLQNEVQLVASLMNAGNKPGEAMVRGNDVALSALRIGLDKLKRDIKKVTK